MFERRELELDTIDNLIELTEEGDIDWERGERGNVLFQTKIKDWVIEIRSRRREVFVEGRREDFLSFCIREQGNNQKLVKTIRDKKGSEVSKEVQSNEEFMERFSEKLKDELEV